MIKLTGRDRHNLMLGTLRMNSRPFILICMFGLFLVPTISHVAIAQDQSEVPSADSALPNSEPAKPNALKVEDFDSSIAETLLTKLSPEHMKSLGQMLDSDWKQRPEWGDMLVALLRGEPMRLGMGWWKPSDKRYAWDWLRKRYDADESDSIVSSELPEDLQGRQQLFERLDRDGDNHLTAADFDWANQPPPTPGAMMANALFQQWDFDSNGRITPDELQSFLQSADREKSGFLTPEDLVRHLEDPESPAEKSAEFRPKAADFVKMLFRGDRKSVV